MQGGKLRTVLAVGIVWFFVVSVPAAVDSQTRVSVGVTETMETLNPYGDSVALLYAIWCQTLGCLGSYDFEKGDYVGWLAERWEVKDPNTWHFYLRRDARWQDGTPVTAADVIHSINRIKTDPQSKQKQNITPIVNVEAVDSHTVKMTTKKPTAPMTEYLFDRVIITSKAIHDKYGPEVADRRYPIGAGPYKVKELIPGQRMVIVKNPDHPDVKKNPRAPDEIIFRVMRELEQRITALLNGEIQIAQFIPPHLRKRVEGSPNTKVVSFDSIEMMFLAMQPKPPFDKKEVRQAVAYAIDRDKIISTLLEGQAGRLDGPIGPGQYGYDPELRPRYEYNPDKARKLLAQAGYPNGVDVELQTPVGRYTLDKQINEVIAAMLNEVGIRTKLQTPEWPTLWANVQKGRVPFYYMGRGGVVDPSVALAQYFETGVSPRIGYSNPKLDKLLALERETFDPAKRKKVLSEAMSLITEEAPGHFLWRHKDAYGMAKNIDLKPRPDYRIFGLDIRLLR
ncbi:MAG: peptide ABC transporter substrate-binding protein [Deltaproteobacteria bacterium]|nr:peptide ABC transporter substrate-binding protein [Deltaproteobacteria bacterium]